MTPTALRGILEAVKAGGLDVEAAAQQLGEPAFGDLGFATIDLHRRERCGFPEVILGEGKTSAWVDGAVRKLVEAKQDCLVTRVNAEQSEYLAKHFPAGQQDRLARTFYYPAPGEKSPAAGAVLIVTAGTGDLPVAQEALVTARVLGSNADLVADVGVAGIHRVLRHREKLAAADVIIVAAGMDGALPSVVGGLVDCPVIAVPTSIGYGAAFGGVAPLLTMLNSCAANVVVVNIDAGFKAGYVAALIARRAAKRESGAS
jgi:hypothetical protein